MTRVALTATVLSCLLAVVASACGAAEYRTTSALIGAVQRYRVKENESLLEIARSFDLGYGDMVAANPDVDPFIPTPGTEVVVPTAWILPDVPVRAGIVINLPEMRLYFFPSPRSRTVLVFPLGIGDAGKDTPVGTYTVIEKIVDPSWYVPESIRLEKPELPKIVPPGPDNPLGSHALRLSERTILIHGTNKPWGIGMRSSHGCLRLYPEDIVQLFPLVDVGTRVTIVNQPVKAAMVGERVFVEVHDYEGVDYQQEADGVLTARHLWDRVDDVKLDQALEEKSGVPVDVTLEP